MGTLSKALGAVVLAGMVSHGFAQQINMGAIGDSMTDEYLPTGKPTATDVAANSWLEILATTRSSDLNFGGYKPSVDDNWGDTRDTGYEYNFAKSGGVASDNTFIQFEFMGTIGPLPVDDPLVGSEYGSTQAAAMASEITGGNFQLDLSYVGMGSNDFFFRTTVFDTNQNQFLDPRLPTTPEGWATWQAENAAEVAGSLLGHVDTLLAADPTMDIIMGLIPPGTAAEGPESAEILEAISQANDLLIAGAAERGVVIIDLWAWTDPSAGYVDEFGNVTIDDLVILADSVADPTPNGEDLSADAAGLCNSEGQCATQSHATKYISEDGIHPNTAIQALVANEMIKAINLTQGSDIQLLTNAEILEISGFNAEVPLPGAAWLFGSGLVVLTRLKKRRV